MVQVCIGVHVHAEPEKLRATLAALRSNTIAPFDLLLLPDGPDAPTRAALTSMGGLVQLGASEPQGAAACFNRLAASSQADVMVLLESGSLVGPGWLEHLLAALGADPHNGLAGPSTNLAWNEQGVFPDTGSRPADIDRAARQASARFGSEVRSLEPLYSLADFCYAVRREVVQAVGAADEGYGLGPCWEMDYNIRAKLAGFRGVWACAAYVHRLPFTARRRQVEKLRFEASKQRYQDKFCGLRLRGERGEQGEQGAYEPHCRGEACEHFAPQSLVRIDIPLQPLAAQPETSREPARPAGMPLVSCIMPTRDRAEFVLQSIRYFQRQDYPDRELIIVDDGRDDLSGRLPADPSIRFVRMPPGTSIGAKRNKGCQVAHGELIVQWDDDDWYSPERLRLQVEPLLSGRADITGLKTDVFFDLTAWKFWRCSPELHRRMFVQDVHGGTLAFQRRVWRQLGRYPDRSLAEDAYFLQQAIRKGARLRILDGAGLFVYLRHASNAWSFVCGKFLDPAAWHEVAEPPALAHDRAFYAGRAAAAPGVPTGQPLVSCIMPTFNRRPFVSRAIDYFLAQDYPNKELVIVDDGTDSVADLVPDDPRIRTLRLDHKHSLGAKRNIACREARGQMIVHWDDDDWMAGWRVRYQAECLLSERADICGLNTIFFYDPAHDRAWQYVYADRGRPWVYGGTLCYTRAFWQAHPFPEITIGEDTRFVWSSSSARIAVLKDNTFYVALIHPGNTSPKRTIGQPWRPCQPEVIRRFAGDIPGPGGRSSAPS